MLFYATPYCPVPQFIGAKSEEEREAEAMEEQKVAEARIREREVSLKGHTSLHARALAAVP